MIVVVTVWCLGETDCVENTATTAITSAPDNITSLSASQVSAVWQSQVASLLLLQCEGRSVSSRTIQQQYNNSDSYVTFQHIFPAVHCNVPIVPQVGWNP